MADTTARLLLERIWQSQPHQAPANELRFIWAQMLKLLDGRPIQQAMLSHRAQLMELTPDPRWPSGWLVAVVGVERPWLPVVEEWLLPLSDALGMTLRQCVEVQLLEVAELREVA